MILDSIKRLLGLDEIPREAEIIYLEAKDEEEAGRLLRAEKGRMVRYRETIIEDIGVLETEEGRLMDEGRRASSPISREVLARQVAEIRDRASAFLNRIDIITRKVAVFDQQLDLLEDKGVLTGPMPDPELMERTAGDVDAARRELEGLIDLSEATNGVNRMTGNTEQSDIVREMAGETAAEEPSFEDLVKRHERGRRSPRETREPEAPLEE